MKEDEIIPAVLGILRRELEKPFRLYLFGSRATGRNRPGADFDLLLDTGSEIDLRRWSQLLEAIEELPTLYSIDLTDKNKADPEFLKTIKGEIIDVTSR